jgi:hypothetical protein
MITRNKLAIAILTVFTLALSVMLPIAQEDTNSVEFQFVNHIQAGLIEQDVYVANEDGTVQRINGASPISVWYQPVYATAAAVHHDPMGLEEDAMAPQEMGAELGLTMGEWLSANGSGTYTVNGDEASLNFEAHNLIPNGVYTVWCAHMTMPDDAQIIDLPCGNEDGSKNIFTADENGDIEFALESMPALAPVTDNPTEIYVIALAYHSDGQTYGANPGDFGLNSHVHIFAMITPEQIS